MRGKNKNSSNSLIELPIKICLVCFMKGHHQCSYQIRNLFIILNNSYTDLIEQIFLLKSISTPLATFFKVYAHMYVFIHLDLFTIKSIHVYTVHSIKTLHCHPLNQQEVPIIRFIYRFRSIKF